MPFQKTECSFFKFPSDLESKGIEAGNYGVYYKQNSVTKQVLIATNRDEIIRCSNVALIGINPRTMEFEMMQKGVHFQVSNANLPMMTNESRKAIIIVIVAISIIVMCSCGMKVY